MIRLEPLPRDHRHGECKFCQRPADARITVGNGRRLRLKWLICEGCVESWRLTLERRKQVA